MRNVSQSRVAFFMPNLKTGGTERMMCQLATGFADQGIGVDFILVKAEGQFVNKLPSEINLVDLNQPSTYLSLLPLIVYLRKNRPQVLISALDLTNLVAILSRPLSRLHFRLVIRLVNTISIQQRSPTRKKIEKYLLGKFYPLSDEIIAVSNFVADDFSRYTGIPAVRVRTIYNPVILPELSKLSLEPVEHPWFAPGQPPVVLSAGRLTYQKNYECLVQAFFEVEKHVDARLVILGEGEDRLKLEKLVHELKLEHRVNLPGNVTNPYSYMSRAAVFALSSHYEGLPNVLIEAMACGCPVVSTNSPGGAAEILGNGEYGHLVEPDNPGALSEAILDVLHGQAKFVPENWLEKFKINTVVTEYRHLLGV